MRTLLTLIRLYHNLLFLPMTPENKGRFITLKSRAGGQTGLCEVTSPWDLHSHVP